MSTLHITNGDCAAATLRQFADGPVTITADVLHEGPAPRADGGAWHDVRARYLAEDGSLGVEKMRRDLAVSDRALRDAVARGDQLVLWFEHDLFDQLLLIRTLDLLVRLKADTTYDTNAADDAEATAVDTDATYRVSGFSRPSTALRAALRLSKGRTVSLICIDRFPGVERFVGLGQLTAEQLASLYPSRRPVTPDQFALASEAWDAFRSPDPGALLDIAARSSDSPRPQADTAYNQCAAALPFLRDALRRFLAEYPSTTNGLSRTEQLALHVLADSAGAMTGAALFVATQAAEASPFMGDATFFHILHGLATARTPLVTVGADPVPLDLSGARVAITAAGRDVLAGLRDRVVLNGIDLWRGGVHLSGEDRSPWRWDARRETLVS